MKKIAVSVVALFALAAVSMAGAINQFKAGDISFSVLDKDGVTPVSSASIKLLSSETGDVVAEATADELGQAVVAIDAGRYLLNISDLNLAVFDVSSAEGISTCRVIMPDAALLVGGQDDDSDGGASVSGGAAGAAGGTFYSSQWVWLVGGVTAVGLLVGAGAIIDHNTHHHHHGNGEQIELPPTVPTYHKKSTPKKSPSKT